MKALTSLILLILLTFNCVADEYTVDVPPYSLLTHCGLMIQRDYCVETSNKSHMVTSYRVKEMPYVIFDYEVDILEHYVFVDIKLLVI